MSLPKVQNLEEKNLNKVSRVKIDIDCNIPIRLPTPDIAVGGLFLERNGA